MTTTTDNFANVPHPAGAVEVCDWTDVQYNDPNRYFRVLPRLSVGCRTRG